MTASTEILTKLLICKNSYCVCYLLVVLREKLLVLHLNDLFLLVRIKAVKVTAALLPQVVPPFSLTQR